MKKIFLLIIGILLLTGCSTSDKITCDIGNTVVDITLKQGKIINYKDKIKGELTTEEINRLNKSYLNEITNNNDAINKLKDVIAEMGGMCR